MSQLRSGCIISVLLVTATAVAPVSAQDNRPNGQDPGTEQSIDARALLEAALARNDGAAFIQTLLVAIEAAPEETSAAILGTALDLAPEQAGKIAAAIGTAYPDREELSALLDDATVETAQQATPAPEEVDAKAEDPAGGLLKLDAWDGKVELGASKSSGDTNETAISLGFEVAQVIGKVWDHRFTLVGDYTRRASVTTRERLDTDYQLFYRAWDRTYLFSFTGFEYDRFGGFDYRITQAVGGGYTVLKTEAMDWAVEAGPGIRWVQEDTGTSNLEFVGRANSDYAWRINERVTVSNDTSFFIGTNRTTIENTAAIESNLTGALGLKLSFFVRHDTEAPAGTSKTDTITRANLVYDF